jgi:hypothetical protein
MAIFAYEFLNKDSYLFKYQLNRRPEDVYKSFDSEYNFFGHCRHWFWHYYDPEAKGSLSGNPCQSQ